MRRKKNKEELTAAQFRKGHPPDREGLPPVHKGLPAGSLARDPGAYPTLQQDSLGLPITRRESLLSRPGYDKGCSSDPPVIDICQQCASRPISDLLAYSGRPVVRNETGDGPDAQPPG